jgi:hypothetical protein
MFSSYEDCSYGYGSTKYSIYDDLRRNCEAIGLSAGEIVTLVGVIFVTWVGALLIAYYFKKSQRVKLALTK